MNYYYLAASLPMLSLEEPPPMSLSQFRDLCRQNLIPADRDALDALLDRDGAGSDNPFVVAWRNREIQIRNAAARLRASRAGKDPSPYLREQQSFDASTELTVTSAFSRASPLEREMEIDRARWKMIDDVAGFIPFTASTILAYALKLRLAERWASMEPAKGRQVVDEIVNRA